MLCINGTDDKYHKRDKNVQNIENANHHLTEARTDSHAKKMKYLLLHKKLKSPARRNYILSFGRYYENMSPSVEK